MYLESPLGGRGGWGGAKVWRNKGKPSLMHANDIKLDKFLRGMVKGGGEYSKGKGECSLSPPKMHLTLLTLTVTSIQFYITV